MNRKMIGEAIYIRVSKIKSDSHRTWKCADTELQRQIRCFPYEERSDVTRLQQVEQKAVGRQKNLGLTKMNDCCLTPNEQFFSYIKNKLHFYEMMSALY
jgi:hypothetical protein